MRDDWEGLKNGCPWIGEKGRSNLAPHGYDYCKATREDCHYKGCAIAYWFRHLMKQRRPCSACNKPLDECRCDKEEVTPNKTT